jgi:uncharacterized membrane protein YozB (DUF420 family)
MNIRLLASEAPHTPNRARFYSPAGDRAFFSAMALAVTCTILLGFSRTYLLARAPGIQPLPAVIQVHAALFTAWLGLYITQTQLIVHGQPQSHRRLGITGALLAAVMLVVGIDTAVVAANHGYRGLPGQQFPDSHAFMLVSLRDILVFSTLLAFGLCWRKDAATHKRLMQTAVVGGLLPPGAARLPVVNSVPPLIGLVMLLFLVAGPIYDLTRYRRVHPAYIWGGLLSGLTLVPLLQPIAMTATWHRTAAWIIATENHVTTRT